MALLTDGDQGHRDKLGSPSSATNIRAGKQRMAYVLLPRLSRRLHIAARSSIQSTHFNESENTHSSQVGPSTSTSTNALVRSRTAHSDADDDEFASMSDGSLFSDYTLASDYSESNRITTRSRGHLDKEELFAKIAGGKRPRDDDEDENGASNNSGVSAVRSEAKRRKQSRKTDSEQDHSADEDEAPANPLPSGPMPEISASSSASKAVIRTKPTRKRRRKTQSKQFPPLPDDTAIRDHRLFVHANGNGFIFTFRNRCCTHSTEIRPLHNAAQESSPDFDTSCIALESFDMFFYRPLNMVFCRTHNICIPLSSLRRHITSSQIRRRHTGVITGSFGMNTVDSFLAHVASAFGLPLDQTFHSQGPDTKQLPKPIPYMEAPRIYLQCPSCKIWLNRRGKEGWKGPAIVRHLGKTNSECAQLLEIPESERPALKECYGQRPCGTTGLGPFVKIIGWSPQALQADESFVEEPHVPANPTKIDPLSQQYVGICKWNIDFPISVAEALHEICLLPSSLPFFDSDPDDGDDDDPEETLERGLYEVQHFLRRYLEDSNAFVNRCEVGFRSNITAG